MNYNSPTLVKNIILDVPILRNLYNDTKVSEQLQRDLSSVQLLILVNLLHESIFLIKSAEWKFRKFKTV